MIIGIFTHTSKKQNLEELKMAKLTNGIHTFNMRIDKDLLMFLKQNAMKKECSMTSLVTKCLNDYKKRIEKREAAINSNNNV